MIATRSVPRETRSTVRTPMIGVVVCILLMVSSCLKVPTAADAQEASDVLNALKARYSFRVMRSGDPGPAVYFGPHPDYTEILVYGDYTPEERSQIITHLRAVRSEVATKPIHLYFYPREHVEKDLIQEKRFP